MILINPPKEILIPVGLTVGMKSFFRLRTINKYSGKIRIDTDWFPNTILNAGRNIMATRSDWLNYCQVGSGNIFPVLLADRQAETSLQIRVAGTNNITVTSSGQAGAAPYYGYKQNTYRFAAGTVAANLNEVGCGWGASLDTLVNRAQILDPVSLLPATVTPLIDEMLEVTNQFRYYAPSVDVILPQVTLEGVVYDTITRAASVTGSRWSTDIGTAIGQYSAVVADWSAYDGVIGAVTTAPSGTSAACDNANQSNSGYSNNSYQLQMNCSVGSTGWNLGAGIRSVRIRTTAGDYQTQFSSNPGGLTIPKNTARQMQMAWTIAWAELP